MNVKFCGLCRLTMIPLSETNLATEQCSGQDYYKCALVRERHEGPLPKDRCPFLSVGDVHYCALAPIPKLIPCNQTTVSRCTNEGHKYCQLFLDMARAGEETSPADGRSTDAGDQMIEISMPDSLAYAPNHLWFDCGNGRTCHVGVDAFFGRALGKVDEVIYPHHENNRRPMVRFRTDGFDFDLVFPGEIQEIEINAHLVADPSEVLRDPYGRGWLFEGVTLPARRNDAIRTLEKDLLRGAAARRWMNQECARLNGFVHEHLHENSEDTGLPLPFGCRVQDHLAEILDRRTLVRLHSEFFTLCARGIKT